MFIEPWFSQYILQALDMDSQAAVHDQQSCYVMHKYFHGFPWILTSPVPPLFLFLLRRGGCPNGQSSIDNVALVDHNYLSMHLRIFGHLTHSLDVCLRSLKKSIPVTISSLFVEANILKVRNSSCHMILE